MDKKPLVMYGTPVRLQGAYFCACNHGIAVSMVMGGKPLGWEIMKTCDDPVRYLKECVAAWRGRGYEILDSGEYA